MLTKNKTLAIIAIATMSASSFTLAAETTTTDAMPITTTESGREAAVTTATTTATGSFKIDKVESVIAKTIVATFSTEVSKDGAVIKVMEDNRISSTIPDTTDTKKVTLVLNDDIKTGSTYTLFLV